MEVSIEKRRILRMEEGREVDQGDCSECRERKWSGKQNLLRYVKIKTTEPKMIKNKKRGGKR